MPSSFSAFYKAALDRAFIISLTLIAIDKPIVSSESLIRARSLIFKRSASKLGKNFLARALAFP